MSRLPFRQRFGINSAKPIDQDFPETGRIALGYLIDELVDLGSIESEYSYYPVIQEILRTARLTYEQADLHPDDSLLEKLTKILRRMDWWQVYTFCERVYERHIGSVGHSKEDVFVEVRSKLEMQNYFESELNNILNEENVSFRFVGGQFQHRGRAQTQKSIQRVGSVLASPQFSTVLQHYNKARKFFDLRPQPDNENCVKEAVCALEAAVHTLANLPTSTDFNKVIKQLQGNDAKEIPPPIAEGIIRLYAYRGSGQGIAHAALQGNKVTEIEAELVLSLVASYVTYLVDLLSQPEEDIPF